MALGLKVVGVARGGGVPGQLRIQNAHIHAQVCKTDQMCELDACYQLSPSLLCKLADMNFSSQTACHGFAL